MREARERRGLTQADLARAAGVSAGTIGNVEAGSRKQPRDLLAIAEALGVDPHWLANGIGGPIPTSPEYLTEGGATLRENAPNGYTVSYPRDSVEAAVPVQYEGRPDASGAIGLHDLRDGGVVGAAFTGPAAFAIKVNGDALHPAARHGSYIVCDPDAPPVPGELVLVEFQDGGAALRELVILRDHEITTAAVLGGGRDTRPLAEVLRLVPVVMVVSSSRWRPAP